MVGRTRGSIETAEKDLWFKFTQDGTYYIDIAQCLSLVNRKFYRQGMQYVVENMELNADGVVASTVRRLPETWVVANAWEKTMRLWLQQQNETADDAGLESTRAAYRDFKIYLDSTHVAGGFASNAIPDGVRDLSALPADSDYEWSNSEVVIPNSGSVGNTVEKTLHMIGDDVGSSSAGMIKAYASSRSRPFTTDPNQPDFPTGGLFGQMFDVGDDDNQIVTNYQSRNNHPPYIVGVDDSQTEYYPGGSDWSVIPAAHLETIMTIRNTAPTGGVYHTTYSPGFIASCGLIRLDFTFPDNTNEPSLVFFKLAISAGNYKGVAARSMAVVN